MASIDKTYTDSYKDYKEFKTWADTQVLTFFDGHQKCIGDYVWLCEEEDFEHGEIPIMNTPTWLDIYLIQNCKSEFVLERMKCIYGDAHYEKFKTVDLTSKPPETFKRKRKISITKSKPTSFEFHSKPYGGGAWWLQCDGDFWYNSDTKKWVHSDSYYPRNTNTAHVASIKSLMKHLRRQYLPAGVVFTLKGRYIDENYTVSVY